MSGSVLGLQMSNILAEFWSSPPMPSGRMRKDVQLKAVVFYYHLHLCQPPSSMLTPYPAPSPLFSQESYSSDWSYSHMRPFWAGPGCGFPWGDREELLHLCSVTEEHIDSTYTQPGMAEAPTSSLDCSLREGLMLGFSRLSLAFVMALPTVIPLILILANHSHGQR